MFVLIMFRHSLQAPAYQGLFRVNWCLITRTAAAYSSQAAHVNPNISNAALEALQKWLSAHALPAQVLSGYLRWRIAAAPATMRPLQQPWSCPCAAITPCQRQWHDAVMLPEGSCRMLTSRSSRQCQVVAHTVHGPLPFCLL